MIEGKFIKDIVREYQIQDYIASTLKNVGFSSAKVHKTPLGEKIVVRASRPGLIVGRKGENIQKLTQSLKTKFKLENPQIEIIEIEAPMLDPMIVAERIASSLERFGLSKFKGIGHKMVGDVMNAGAQGVEILISGKIPSSRAKRWRFYQGYLKKSGDVAVSGIDKAYAQARLKTGTVGIQVRITPKDLSMPDTVEEITALVEEVAEIKPAKSTKKKITKKKVSKKDADSESSKSDAKEEEKSEAKENDDTKVDDTEEKKEESKSEEKPSEDTNEETKEEVKPEVKEASEKDLESKKE